MLSPDQRFNPRDSQGQSVSHETVVSARLGEAREAMTRFEFSKAEDLINSAIETADSHLRKQHPLRVITREARANLAIEQGDIAKAIDVLGQAIQILVLSPHSPHHVLPDFKMRRADLCNEIGRYPEAQALWHSCFHHRDASPADRCLALLGMARSHHLTGDLEAYATNINLAINLANQVITPILRRDAAFALFHGSSKEADAGRFLEAALLSSTALDLLENTGLSTPTDRNTAASNIALFLERAGRLDEAQSVRKKLLSVVEQSNGAADAEAMSVRHSYAMTALDRGRFEEAETLLARNLECARVLQDNDIIIDAALALSSAYREQGLYKDATDILESTKSKLPEKLDITNNLKLLQSLALGFASRGALQKADRLLELALETAEQLGGVEAIVSQAVLHTTRASLFTFTANEKAKQSLTLLHELLVQLPPGQEPIPPNELKILSLRIRNSEENYDEIINRLKDSLNTLTREHGVSRSYLRADILLQIGTYQKKDDHELARASLEQAREVLENSGRIATPLYAAVLRELVEVLPFHDPRIAAFSNISQRLFEKVQKSFIQDTESPFDDGQDHSE